MSFAAGVKFLFKFLVLPPNGPMLLAIIGLLLMTRKPRTGRAFAWTGVASLLLLCIPAVSDALVETLRPPQPFSVAPGRDAGAIVILGGGVRENALEYGGDTLGRLTLDRVRYGARVARLTGLPVLVSGGRPNPETLPEAVVMRDTLEREFSVDVRWVEDRSTNTHENALFSTGLLKANGIDTIVLVAHGFDMRRAKAEFEAAGMRVIPAATQLSGPGTLSIRDWLPSAAALQTSYYATYELFGLLAFELRDLVQ